MSIYDYILNKNTGQQFYTGTVITLSPLTVKLFDDDTAIPVVPTSNLFGVAVGSKLIMSKIDNEFFAVGYSGSPKIDSCQIYRSTDQTVSVDTATKIEFSNELLKVGSNLNYNSTNKSIEIGAGISKVSARSQCFLYADDVACHTSLYIYKNSTLSAWQYFPGRVSGQSGFRSISCSIDLSVTEGDDIYAYVEFDIADASNVIKGYTGANILIVKALEYDLA